MSSLKRKSVLALRWNVLDQSIGQIINLTTNVILLRLLLPEEFGYFAIPFVIICFIKSYQDFGSSAFVIHKIGITRNSLASLHSFNIIIGLLLSVILFICGYVWYSNGTNTILPTIFLFLIIVIPLSGFTYIPEASMRKNLDFKQLFIVNIVSIIVSSIVAIISALCGSGVFALVIKFILYNFILLLGYSYFHWITPINKYSKSLFKELRTYSIPLVSSQGINFISSNIDTILIGNYIGYNSLGLYDRAYKVILFPLQQVSATISKVLFPFFTASKKDEINISLAYMRIIKLLLIIVFPLFFFMASQSEYLVGIVFGQRWKDISPIVKVFIIISAFKTISSLNGVLYLTYGKTLLQFKINLFSQITVVISIILGVFYFNNIYDLAYCYGIAILIIVFPEWYFSLKLAKLSVTDFLIYFVKVLAVSIVFFSIGFLAIQNITNYHTVYFLSYLFFILVILYFTIHFLFNEQKSDLCKLIISLRNQ